MTQGNDFYIGPHAADCFFALRYLNETSREKLKAAWQHRVYPPEVQAVLDAEYQKTKERKQNESGNEI